MGRCFVVPEIALDRSKSESLRQQIFSQIAEAIRRGALPHGVRLPSSRILAHLLSVSRNTVVDAYERLLEDGLVTTRPGSGVEVNHHDRSSVPNLANFRAIARAAHYPLRTIQFEDSDRTVMYLNVAR